MGGKPMHEQLKNSGNDAFAKGKLDAAIDFYTEAICLSAQPTYHTNRALCYIKKGQFPDAVSDCDKAVRMDSDSVKGYYFRGLAQEGLNDLDHAVVNMEKALDICNMGKGNSSESFVNDIRATIKQTQKKRAQLKVEERYKHLRDLQSDLAHISDVAHRAMLRDVEANDGLTESAKAEARQQLRSEFDDRQAKWKAHFEDSSPLKASAMEVPDFLCCKISMDICADPCTTPDGITYDRGVLEQHLKANPFDPVTRSPLRKHQLYPNLALREAIQSYYRCNPWADDLEMQ